MKLGILISSILLVVIILAVYVSSRGVPQQASDVTAPAMLEKRDLSGLDQPFDVKKGKAEDEWKAIWSYYRRYSNSVDDLVGLRRSLDETDKSLLETGKECLDLVLAAAEAGSVSGDFLDDTTPIEPRGKPQFGASMKSVCQAAMVYASYLNMNEIDKDKARAGGKAVWAMGYQMFDRAVRLPVRIEGMELMRAAITAYYPWAPDGSQMDATLNDWIDELEKIDRKYWRPKQEVIYSLEPNVGDLLNIAYDDEDPSFRVEAVLTLAWVKWNPRSKGNGRAVSTAIDKLKNDPDPMVKKAAKVVDEFSEDDLMRL